MGDEPVRAGAPRRARDRERERGDSDGECPRCRPPAHVSRVAIGEGFGAPRRAAMKSRYQ